MSRTIRFLSFLDRQNKTTLWATVLVLLLVLGIIDYATGADLSIAFFYLIPISLASWSLGPRPGLVTAAAATIILQGANLLSGGGPTNPAVNLWNTIIRVSTFLTFSILLAEFRVALRHQTDLSRTDALTGILNRRAFYESVSTELKKIDRYQRFITLVSIDLDDFKSINDTLGHLVGDALLVQVTESITRELRATDTLARLGGDEFAILMPETDEAAAEKAMPRIQTALINQMAESKWTVTFSMGALTCHSSPPSVQDTLHLADQLMYNAKRRGKNCIEYSSYPEIKE